MTTVIYLKVPSESIYAASGTVLVGGNTPIYQMRRYKLATPSLTPMPSYWEVPQLSNGEYAAQVVVDGYTVGR
ncbi:MAG: hypothetical protein R3E08_12665 [Thiotrichaceae bacterium]